MDRKWTAKWITSPDFLRIPTEDPRKGPVTARPETDAEGLPLFRNRHQLFRAVFTLPARHGRVQAYVSGDDWYRLFINGRQVCVGPAQGYPFHYYYNAVDVSEYVRKGENLIAAEVLYNGIQNRAACSADGRMGFICEIADGRAVYAATDERWLTARMRCWMPAGLAGMETQTLDILDAARYDGGWKSERVYTGPGAEDFVPARVDLRDDHILFQQPTPPVMCYLVRPEKRRFTASGALLLDFGREIAATLAIHARGRRGERLCIRYSEELLPDGELRYPMRCIKNAYEDELRFSGGEDVFAPFEYKAFRYAELRLENYAGLSSRRDLEQIADAVFAVVRHYPMREDACRFSADDRMLTSIFRVCKNGVRMGTQEAYLDCPSREKGPYLGDAVVTSHSQFLLTGDARLWRKSILDFACSAAWGGELLAVAPSSVSARIADFSLLYPYWVENYVRMTGDEQILAETLPVISDMLAAFAAYARPDGLLRDVTGAWNLVDWPDNARDGYDFPLTNPIGPGCHNVVNALWYGAVSTYERLRRRAPRVFCDEPPVPSERLAASFRSAFGGGADGLFRDSEQSRHCSFHANVYPLFFGMTDGGETAAAVEMLRRRGLKGGVFTAYFALMALGRLGEIDLGLRILRGDGETGWLRMVKEGATACYEAWGRDAKWNTSLCHPWASAPVAFFIEYLAGLRFTDPAAGTYALRPALPEGCENLSLSVKLPQGSFSAEIGRGGRMKLRVSGKIRIQRQ